MNETQPAPGFSVRHVSVAQLRLITLKERIIHGRVVSRIYAPVPAESLTQARRWGFPDDAAFDHLAGEHGAEKAAAFFADSVVKTLASAGANDGNAQAVEMLCRLAASAAEAVRTLMNSSSEEVRQIVKETSRNMDAFPVLLSPRHGFEGDRYFNGILDRLELSAETMLAGSGNFRTHNTPVQKSGNWHGICERLSEVIKEVMNPDIMTQLLSEPESLPEWIVNSGALGWPLRSQEDADLLFDIAWGALLWAFDGDPLRHPDIREMAEDRTGHEDGSRGKPRGGDPLVAFRTQFKKEWMKRHGGYRG